MRRDIEDTELYLRETLHTPVSIGPWRGESGLPSYLRERYRFFEGMIGGAPILLLQTDEDLTPGTATKHERALQQTWPGSMAFVLHAVTARSRQRLVDQGVAFVVPRNQVYLPMLGVNLAERFKQRMLSADRLRPSAQLLLLHALTEPRTRASTPSAAAKLLGYTAVAMGQALDQLEGAGLVLVRKTGRERVFELAGDPVVTWEGAQPVLASPVKRRRYMAGALPLADAALTAGLSALAEYSSLAEPRVPVVAASAAQSDWLDAKQNAHERPAADEADFQVEVWSYAPVLLAAKNPAVDRLSLYLSLREDPDERVQSALEEMMRGMRW
jgi:hypothetical protein